VTKKTIAQIRLSRWIMIADQIPEDTNLGE
jgi:hypothetical protein